MTSVLTEMGKFAPRNKHRGRTTGRRNDHREKPVVWLERHVCEPRSGPSARRWAGWGGMSLTASKEHGPADTFIWDFLPPELWENKCLLSFCLLLQQHWETDTLAKGRLAPGVKSLHFSEQMVASKWTLKEITSNILFYKKENWDIRETCSQPHKWWPRQNSRSQEGFPSAPPLTGQWTILSLAS